MPAGNWKEKIMVLKCSARPIRLEWVICLINRLIVALFTVPMQLRLRHVISGIIIIILGGGIRGEAHVFGHESYIAENYMLLATCLS